MPTKKVDDSPVYQLKVTLKESAPPIWRRIEVRGSIPLSRLHTVLQTVMGWTDSHLHEFVVGDVRYGMRDLEWDPLDRPKDERRARLGAIVTGVKDRFRYEYDLGDGWEHDVVVEKIFPAEAGVRYPRCIGGKRACPPEDVGGIWGYGDFLEALRDPAHEEHEAMVEWSGGSFDPEAFDLGSDQSGVDAALRARRATVAGPRNWYYALLSASCYNRHLKIVRCLADAVHALWHGGVERRAGSKSGGRWGAYCPTIHRQIASTT